MTNRYLFSVAKEIQQQFNFLINRSRLLKNIICQFRKKSALQMHVQYKTDKLSGTTLDEIHKDLYYKLHCKIEILYLWSFLVLEIVPLFC